MTFTLYDAATGGTALWTDTQSVDVQNGSYAVELGSTPNPLSASIFSGGQVWLEITVGTGTPMTPRQKLNSVPYAFEAVNAQTAATATTVTGTASGDGSGLTNLDWANIVNVPAGFADGTDDVATSVDGMSGGTINGGLEIYPLGTVLIGDPLTTQLYVQSDSLFTGQFINNSSGGRGGVSTYGVYASAEGPAGFEFGNTNFGTYSVAKNGHSNVGVYGLADNPNTSNVGVKGEALGSGLYARFGLWGHAEGGAKNYGVYASAPISGADDFAGYLDGDAAVTGAMTVGIGAKDTGSQLRVSTGRGVAGQFSNISALSAGEVSYGLTVLNNAATSGGATEHYGAYAQVAGADRNYGFYGTVSGGGNNYAVYGAASGGQSNIAGYFDGDESDGSTTAAVEIVSPGQKMLIDGNEIDSNVALHLNYTSAQDVDIAHGGGNVGIGLTAPETTLHVAGGNWDVG
ncbi:MAG: hypothetical protein D6800_03465, partial [Candidatus Zixiibacteriota bacterium]